MSNPFSELYNVVRKQAGGNGAPPPAQTPSGLLIIGREISFEGPAQPAPPPIPPYVAPEIKITVVSGDDPRLETVEIDRENNVITGYFSEHHVDINFNEDYYKTHVWLAQYNTTGVDGLFSYQIGMSLIPSCRFYAPSNESLENGSTPHPDYHYYNTLNIAVCLNPELASSKNWTGMVHAHCPHNVQNSCPSYEAHEWVETHYAYIGDVAYRVEANYLNDRRLAYRIVSVTGEVKKIHNVMQITNDDDVNTVVTQFQELVGEAEVHATGRSMTPSVEPVAVNFLQKLVATGA